MKLSIIVLFSDRDFNCVSDWIANTEKNVKVEHEIIIVDNTTDGVIVQQNLETDCIKGVRGSKDLGCFAGRKLGFNNSKGQYIWHVDGDDDILPLKKFEYDADLVCFNYLIKHKGETTDGIGKDPYFMPYLATATSFYHAYWKSQCKNMVWNKFVKREILENIYPSIPDFEMYTSEDALLSLLEEMIAKSIYFDNKAFYRYYKCNGMSESNQMDIEKFKRLFKGTKEGWTVYKLLTTDEERKNAGITVEDLMINLCKYGLEQNERCETIFKDYVLFMVEYFSKNLLLNVLELHKAQFKKNYYRIKKIVNDYF